MKRRVYQMTQPPDGATASDLARWYREPSEPLPARIEWHLDLLLRRHALECEVEALRRRWSASRSKQERAQIRDEAEMIQATIGDLGRQMEEIMPRNEYQLITNGKAA